MFNLKQDFLNNIKDTPALGLILLVMLITALVIIYFLQKSRKRHKRIKQDYDTLALARDLKCDTRDPQNLAKVGLPKLHAKEDSVDVIAGEVKAIVAFVVIILVSYLTLAVYMHQQQLDAIAMASIAFALIGVLLLFLSLRKLKHGRHALETLKQHVDAHEKTFSDETPSTEAEISASDSDIPSIIRCYRKPLHELIEIAEMFSEVVPQDSTLKRHFMTQLLSETEASLEPRPTDATLKRHYDQLLESKLIEKLQALTERGGSKAATIVVQSKVIKKAAIPEDSTLQRHFITELRSKLEQQLCMPRPTDFNLRRHYETLIQSLLEKELNENYS